MFCTNSPFRESLYQLIQNDVINLNSKEIEVIYNFWETNFDEHLQDLSEDIKIVCDKNLISQKQEVPDFSFLSGIDFPTWFNDFNTKGKKIMIIGIDPLRNEKAFRDLNADINTKVVIGTPYALHLPIMRYRRSKNYWTFINMLSQNNFVYLTDFYKVFFYTKHERSYNYYERNNCRHKELLNKEIELIKPDLIISFGSKSVRQIVENFSSKLTRNVQQNLCTYKGVPVLPMVHLSGLARKKSFLEVNEVRYNPKKNYGEHYYEIIAAYLNKQD